MFSLTRPLGSFRHLFVTAFLTLPNSKHGIRISSALVDGPVRGNDFTAALRTGAAARRARLNVNGEWVVARHN